MVWIQLELDNIPTNFILAVTLEISKTNGIANLEMKCSYAHLCLIAHLLESYDANKEEYCNIANIWWYKFDINANVAKIMDLQNN